MGQYYLVINKTKKQYLSPHVFGDGAKACELLGGDTLNGLGILLIKSNEGGGGDLPDNPLNGQWAGDEIVIIGDYDSSELYNIAKEQYADISKRVMSVLKGIN
jgi:hypothetical protein